MSNLLLHSMRELAPVFAPVLTAAGARNIAEIGAEHGSNTDLLARYADLAGGRLTTIDPAPSPAFVQWAAENPHVTHLRATSLEAIAQAGGQDAWFIDGDHNWYTVYNELKAVSAAQRSAGKPLLAFLHDVSWPCARRDSYYAPDRIPAEHRQPYRYDAGVTLDSDGLLPKRGFRGEGRFAWAMAEGGPRNGVLTAVEDFVAEEFDKGIPYGWAAVPAVFGMGVLYSLDATWAPEVARLLAPWHHNPVLMAMEESRLRNYLAVIDWQDRARQIAPVAA